MSTNFLQWNAPQANQETDAEYLADTQRANGAPVGAVFPSPLANKLFYQMSTMCTAIADALVSFGESPSDANLATLTALMEKYLSIPTITLKEGNGSTVYSVSPSLSLSDVDASALAYTVVIPVGSKLAIWASGSVYVNAIPIDATMALYDSEPGTQILAQSITPGNDLPTAFAMNTVIAGDGNSHTIKLQWTQGTVSGGNTMFLQNTPPGLATMLFMLMRAN